MRGLGYLRRKLRKQAPGGLILLYHRVTTLDSDPQFLSVTPGHFAEHLEVLHRQYRPTTLSEIATDKGASENAVAITFDDGYADNQQEALPVLTAAEWPATIFVQAGQIGQEREFWWDELERVFLRTAKLPGHLRLNVCGAERIWQMGDCNRPCDPDWNVLHGENMTDRQSVYVELAALLKIMEDAERERVLGELRVWAGLPSAGRPSHRSLDEKQLCALAASRNIEIGAHTMSHPSLASIPLTSQQTEIAKSKSTIETMIGKPVLSFSYPFGGRGDFCEDTMRLVSDAGFDLACANFPGVVGHPSDRYQLPRVLVRDWDGDVFARHLCAWRANG